jgi:hypothetical protein
VELKIDSSGKILRASLSGARERFSIEEKRKIIRTFHVAFLNPRLPVTKVLSVAALAGGSRAVKVFNAGQ